MLYTVYGLHEAGKPEEIRYIGLTTQKPEQRLKTHLNDAKRESRPVSEWIFCAVTNGIKIQCRTLAQTEDAHFAASLEKQLIADYVRAGYPLCNVQCSSRRANLIAARTARKRYLKSLRAIEEIARSEKAEQLRKDIEKSVAEVRAEIASGRLDLQAFLSGQNEQA